MSQPGFEPPDQQAGALPKNYSNSLLVCYLESLLSCPVAYHTWTRQARMYCRLLGNKLFIAFTQVALASSFPRIIRYLQVRSRRGHHYGELDQGHFHSSIKHPETDMSQPGFEPPDLLYSRQALYQRAILKQFTCLLFGTPTWLPQCMWLSHKD
jgi:hypothetical protein